MAYKEYILHGGRVKEVHGKYSNMILYKDPSGGVKSVLPYNVKFCDATGKVFTDEVQASLKGQKVINDATLIKEPLNQGVTVKIGNNNPLPKSIFQEVPYSKGGQEDKEKEESLNADANNPLGENGLGQDDNSVFNLNTLQDDLDIRKAALSISGLGYKTLKTIVRNRPETGYSNIEHVKDVNAGSIPRNLKWASMEKYLSF